MYRRWRRKPLLWVDQVGNGLDTGVDLTPASGEPAEAVRAAWAPLLYGQEIPRLGERLIDDQPFFDE